MLALANIYLTWILFNPNRSHQFAKCGGVHSQIGGQVFMGYQLQYVRTALEQDPELFFGTER